MLRTTIKLSDGTQISSGSDAVNAIKSATLTECVNNNEELTIGSTCSNALELTLMTPEGGLPLEAGTEITAYKGDAKIGIFVLENPTRPTANTMKVTGYDRVSKLDRDLTVWLSGLAGWPYTLTTFAGMVCAACGLTFRETNVPNGDFNIVQFSRSEVTGRQLMQWLGEICCRFCRATPDGDIEFAWYEPSGVTISATGDPYYFQNSLSYEDYETEAIGSVQLRLANSKDGALWPPTDEGVNSYIISGNPILNSWVTEDLLPYLENIKNGGLGNAVYTPCKVTIPTNPAIHAGNTVQITDKNGKTITAYVMTKTQSGQKDTLQCTGSRRRDSSAVVNNKTSAEKTAAAESYADAAAKAAVSGQTQQDIFNKLTDNGRIKGIFSRDGVWVINADEAVIDNLIANIITSGILKSKDGGVWIDLDKGEGNLTRGTSAYLSTFDEHTGGWTKNVDDVIREFVTVELNKMRTNTVRDFAATLDTNGNYPEGVKLSLHKIRKGSGESLASIAFEWVDGSRSHMSATAITADEAVWEFSEMTWS